jgi:hypothetical protein
VHCSQLTSDTVVMLVNGAVCALLPVAYRYICAGQPGPDLHQLTRPDRVGAAVRRRAGGNDVHA